MMLTGCREGEGVFAKVPAGMAAYEYEGPERVRTLADLHTSTDGGSSA
jgi:hypothetical protein